MNFYTQPPRLLKDLGEIQYKISPRNVAERCEFCKKKKKTGVVSAVIYVMA